jgi:NAD(P)H dehydrogenase (quinone)
VQEEQNTLLPRNSSAALELEAAIMFAITGISGRIGGIVARELMAAGKDVRAVVRDPKKGEAWARQGCDVAVAEMHDEAALLKAFGGTQGVLVLPPPIFDPSPGFTEMRAVVAALQGALAKARPSKVVSISTVGAQATRENLLTQHTIHERVLGELSLPVTFLRPAWFMENAAWDVAPARDTGVIHSFLHPLERRIPMVATRDIGRVAAQELASPAPEPGHRVIELEGPRPLSPHDIAAGFGRLLGRNVTAQVVPRDTWESLFRTQGMKNPLPRIQMLDGFNEGWLTFERPPLRGTVDLETVLRELISAA